MSCSCLGRAPFEAALRKGDVAAALAHLQDEPLATACTHFRSGNTIWHLAAGGGHLSLLQALAARLAEVWPTPQQGQGPPSSPFPAASTLNVATGTGASYPIQDQRPRPHHPQQHPPFQRRVTNPFQRISDGIRGIIGPEPSHSHVPPLAALLNTPNLLGQTALMTACKEGHPACVQFLLSMGANAWYRDRANYTALHYATLHDRGACIEAVLQHPASARPPAGTRQSLVRLVDLPNFAGYTPAHFAAVANKPKALAALLACGANIAARCWAEGSDWISGPAGSTPLHLAARRGDVELCKMMMRHYLEVLRDSGAPDPRLHSDARGFRPYQRAAERGCRELAEMLMPSTPLSYIFGTDVVRLYKVPKLKALASAALQASLLTQIHDAEAEAADRRRLATAAAVAAARAAAAAAGGGRSGSLTCRSASGAVAAAAAAGAAAADGGAADGAAVDAASGGGAPSALSRASSLVSSAVRYVRSQSIRQLGSLRRQIRRSSRWIGRESSQELWGVSGDPSAVGGASDGPPTGGGGGTRTISGVSGVVGYATTPLTPRQSGLPPPPPMRASATAAASAGPAAEFGSGGGTATSGLAPLLSVGSERSAMVRCPASEAVAAAAGGHSHGLAAGSAAAAVLPAAPPPQSQGRMAACLPGGISPVRGSSIESDLPLPFLPPSSWSPMYPALATGEIPPPATALGIPTAAAAFPALGADLNDASVGAWAARASAAAGGGAGCVAGGSPVGAPSPAGGGVHGRMSYCPVSLPSTSATHAFASPFALPAVQTQSLGRASGDVIPSGGSPRYSGGGGGGPPPAPGGGLSHPSGRSPPRPASLSVPGATLGLQPVREDYCVGGGDGEGGDEGNGGGGGGGVGRLSKRASKYALPHPAEARGGSPPPPPPSDFEFDGSGAGGGCGLAYGMQGLGAAAAAAVATVIGRISGDFASGRLPAAASGGATGGTAGGAGDPPVAGGSPLLAASFNLPGALERDTCSSIGAAGGCGGSGLFATGRPQASAGSVTAAAGAAAAAAAGIHIGSDTSEDYCGVCFERPAFLHIRPCQHTLCAECSREVTRMMETQPPSCPFCRGVVHGFGC